MTVLLYQDYIHNNGVLLHALRAHFGADNVLHCDAADILGGCLEKARLLAMPGGADLYYCEKLNGEGNKAIREFVEQGGAYLGICAGAYYACAELEWAKDEKEPIRGARELGFYKGKAVGPVYEFIEDGDINKCWDDAARVITNIPSSRRKPGSSAISQEYPGLRRDDEYVVFYSAGPIFIGDNTAIILARYADLSGQPAAAVECAVGKGKAILCGPHPEYDAESYAGAIYRHRNASYKWQTGVAEKLDGGQQEKFRKAIFDRALPEGIVRHAA